MVLLAVIDESGRHTGYVSDNLTPDVAVCSALVEHQRTGAGYRADAGRPSRQAADGHSGPAPATRPRSGRSPGDTAPVRAEPGQAALAAPLPGWYPPRRGSASRKRSTCSPRASTLSTSCAGWPRRETAPPSQPNWRHWPPGSTCRQTSETVHYIWCPEDLEAWSTTNPNVLSKIIGLIAETTRTPRVRRLERIATVTS